MFSVHHKPFIPALKKEMHSNELLCTFYVINIWARNHSKGFFLVIIFRDFSWSICCFGSFSNLDLSFFFFFLSLIQCWGLAFSRNMHTVNVYVSCFKRSCPPPEIRQRKAALFRQLTIMTVITHFNIFYDDEEHKILFFVKYICIHKIWPLHLSQWVSNSFFSCLELRLPSDSESK